MEKIVIHRRLKEMITGSKMSLWKSGFCSQLHFFNDHDGVFCVTGKQLDYILKKKKTCENICVGQGLVPEHIALHVFYFDE